MEFILKAVISGILVATVSTLAQRNETIAALFMGIPFTAFLSMIFMYYGGVSPEQLSQWSWETITFVLTSLIFFVIFALLIINLNFWWSMIISFFTTAILFSIVLEVLDYFKD